MKTYLFIDLETSGLDPNIDRIVEVGWMYADSKLRRLSSTSYTPVQPVGAAMDRISSNEVVREIHEKTGLLDMLGRGGLPLLQHVESSIVEEMDEIEEQYQAFVKTLEIDERLNPIITDRMEFVLAGKNVHFDRSFIDRYMPRLSQRLSYRHFDETTLRYALEIMGIGINIVPAKEMKGLERHRAGFDVEMSYTTMRFVLEQFHESADTERFKGGKAQAFTIDSYNGEFVQLDIEAELENDLQKLSEED